MNNLTKILKHFDIKPEGYNQNNLHVYFKKHFCFVICLSKIVDCVL